MSVKVRKRERDATYHINPGMGSAQNRNKKCISSDVGLVAVVVVLPRNENTWMA